MIDILINDLNSLDIKPKIKLTKKQQAVDTLFRPNIDGISQWINRDDIMNVKELNWGSNGIARHGIFFGDNRYKWEKIPLKGAIQMLRLNGFSENEMFKASRPIHKDIDKYHKSIGCVVCGSNSDLVTDHKNDLYNDPRVLNIHTQVLDDFQCLCNHCNLQKRQIMKITKETNKRYSAKNIPQLKIFGIDFIKGDETFDINDPNTLIGTYWYDPIAFTNYIKFNMI